MDDQLIFLEEMKEYYSRFNPNFMTGYIAVVDGFYNRLIADGVITSSQDILDTFDKLGKVHANNDGVSEEESIENSLDFFEALHPRYKSMAINLLRESKIQLGDSQRSAAYDIFFSGNSIDSSIACHEVAHSFVVSKDQAENWGNGNDGFMPIFIIISEINSYVAQLLYYDYMSLKKGVNLVPSDLLTSLLVLGDLKRKEKYLKKDERLFKILCGNNLLEHAKEVFEYFFLNPEKDNLNAASNFDRKMCFLSHPFGIMIASYIYQKIQEDPSNIKMFLGFEKAQTMVGSDGVVCRSLEKLGIPCFKDAKLFLDEEVASLLIDATVKTFGMCSGKINKVNTNLFSNGSLIKDEYFQKVNNVFEQTELEVNRGKGKK